MLSKYLNDSKQSEADRGLDEEDRFSRMIDDGDDAVGGRRQELTGKRPLELVRRI